ncbi:endonuclease domain-containing protein [Mycolicibacterium sp. Dal123E01]|uniref:endonuclease domain-containing protein n=1 Tax=Mycolicibacterium sp. Dal123E01 TaxID=3457578 RepID=UPI00403EA288
MEDVPFIGSEALAAGRLTRHELRTRFRAIHQDVYLPAGVELTPVLRAKACWLRSRKRGVLVGFSASAVHGSKWIDNRQAAEISDISRRPTPGVTARAGSIEVDDICHKAGLAITTPARTALDLLCWYPMDTAITAKDALARATRLEIADIELLADCFRGRREIKKARSALDLVDPGAESPRETWLRLLIIRAGFPRPQSQIPVYTEYGVLIARVDMGYEDLKIAIEYEGAQHRTDRKQFDKDIRRHDELVELGWIVLRFTAEDTPGTVMRKVAAALAHRR